MDFLNLDPLLRKALEEDLGRGDLTTEAILERAEASRGGAIQAQAALLAKESLILAGWPVFLGVFQLMDEIEAEVHFEEGAQVDRGTTVGKLQGKASVLLQGERVALNFLQRMSGVATLTQKYVQQLQNKLKNANFVQKAPEHVVVGVRHRFQEAVEQLKKLQDKLDGLSQP